MRRVAALSPMLFLLTGCGEDAGSPVVHAAAPVPASPTRSVDTWSDVVAEVEEDLARADTALSKGDADGAKEAVYDAYFASFEALGMETAIRENVSARRAFELEELFADVRRSLPDRGAFDESRETLVRELTSEAERLATENVELPS